MVVRAAAIWCVLLGVATVTAGLRVAVLAPRVGEPAAHVIGTLSAVAAFIAVIASTIGWVEPRLEVRRRISIGVTWCIATVLFEFGFGHFIAGYSWERLLTDYNLARGRLWPLVLATLVFTPLVTAITHRRRTRADDP
jgi:hypothetical protein